MPRIIQRKYGTFEQRKAEEIARAKKQAEDDAAWAKRQTELSGRSPEDCLRDRYAIPKGRGRVAALALMAGIAMLGELDR